MIQLESQLPGGNALKTTWITNIHLEIPLNPARFYSWVVVLAILELRVKFFKYVHFLFSTSGLTVIFTQQMFSYGLHYFDKCVK